MRYRRRLEGPASGTVVVSLSLLSKARGCPELSKGSRACLRQDQPLRDFYFGTSWLSRSVVAKRKTQLRSGGM